MSVKKDIRKNFRDSVFKRDGYTCKICGMGPYSDSPGIYSAIEYLDAHHITDRSEMPNGGYVKENGITLCKKEAGLVWVEDDLTFEGDSCHMKAEKFHISEGTEWTPNMHPDDLYKLIGSSKEEAIRASEKSI